MLANNMTWIDSHAHLFLPPLDKQVEEVIQRAKKANISNIINICTDPSSLEKALILQKKYPKIFSAGATTCHDIEKSGEKDFHIFEQAAHDKSIVAIGEIGLDYYYKHSSIESQKKFLIRYLHLAKKTKLPVIFHCRNAFDDLFRITDQEYLINNKPGVAVLHCFTGNLKEAMQVIERGWYISFSGIITFKKSESLRHVAAEMPLGRILIETDSPYLAPQTKRGKVNEPSFLPEIGQMIAQIKNCSIEEVAKTTSQNVKNIFSLL